MREKNAVKIPEAILDGINSAENIILLTHVHPDGDALGSSLGLADIFRGMGKEVCIFLEEEVSYLYDFLPGKDSVDTEFEKILSFANKHNGTCLTIALDSGDDRRLGQYYDQLTGFSPFMVIDHHKSHKEYGQHRWVEPGMSSTGEMIYELAKTLGANISYEAAVNLYVAICTDTGSFKYDSTTPRTLRIAAQLVEKGVKPDEIARCLYDNVSYERMKLLQVVLGTLKLHENGALAFMYVSSEMIEESGASVHDIEGFVDYPRSLNTVKVAVFIKQTKAGGLVSVSMRAKGEVDVAEVASIFGGGGHKNAAGFRFHDKNIEETTTLVLEELREKLK